MTAKTHGHELISERY